MGGWGEVVEDRRWEWRGVVEEEMEGEKMGVEGVGVGEGMGWSPNRRAREKGGAC